MPKFWLNFYLKISGTNYQLCKRLIDSDNIFQAFAYLLLILILEPFFWAISLPVYFLVTPEKVQESGFIFPRKEKIKDFDPYRNYQIKRQINLGTIGGSSLVFVLKILLIGLSSFFLLGGQTLLALTQNWSFDNSADYNYNSAKIEVAGGAASLKNLSIPVSGATTNSGFDSSASGWTYADWNQGGGEVNVAGSYVASGGNPGGYVQINVPLGKDDELGGYYYQAFTTTAANPTASLSFNWRVSAYMASPITFKLLAYVDTGSGVPTLGQEVWSSGEITATSAWSATTTIDVSSKVTSAGTYYLKMAVWVETGGTNVGPYTIGYDNVSLNWSATPAPSYATDRPTIRPNTSLTPVHVTSWDSFSETATKNGGEIYYQLSDDNGTTWYYWNNTAWAVAGVTNYNNASTINTNISSFPVVNNRLMWRAYLESNGTQLVSLDDVNIGYTENDLPDISNISAVQSETTNGLIAINYNISDNESDPCSLTAYEYSLTGAFAGEQLTMTASTTAPTHEGTSGLTASPGGTAHVFVWNAKQDLGEIFDDTVYVRLRANDGIGSGAYATSTAFAVDFVKPIISNVTASQNLGTTNVTISYELTDNTADNTVLLDVSEDSGATWTVATSSVSGDIGTSVTAGAGKSIIWNAGNDFDEQAQSDLQVRLRAVDKYLNPGDYASSSDFSIETVNPVQNVSADLQAQPNAGDSSVLIGGSFTEANPTLNDFYVALNGGAYGSASAGATNTATPAAQVTATGAVLDGNDYISGVKIVHTDDYGQAGQNENLSPNSSYKYVKPYTPNAPILSNPVTTHLDLTISPNSSETSGLEYLIQETVSGNYVQADGTLGASPVWRTDLAWGTTTVSGLASPVANYIFRVKSRNTSDAAHAASSESAYSATAQLTNTTPTISFSSVNQTDDGTNYTSLNYTGTDGQGDICSLNIYEYSRDNSTWSTLTEKSGVGSDGVTNLIFLPTGSAHNLKWDSGADLAGIEDSSVYVRLRANDGIGSGSTASYGPFVIDNLAPVVSSVSASQNLGARTVTISYNLSDANSSTVEVDISEDSGATWTVSDTSVSGDVGAGISAGSGKTITWNAGTDFDNQYQADLRVRVRARDTYGNQGNYYESSNFSLDTQEPVLTNVSGVQNTGSDTFSFSYDLSENAGNCTVSLQISNDGGSTWTVPVSSASGDLGSDISTGSGKTISWNAATNYSGHEEQDMKIKVTAVDQYNNSGNNNSVNFNLDTLAPRLTNVQALENLGTTNVAISFDLADQNSSLVEIDISEDGGSSWTVTDTSASGDVGAGVNAGSKTIVWAAGTDFDEQNQNDIRVRIRGKDTFEHQSANFQSANFSLDTLNPVVNTVVDLEAQPQAGDIVVAASGSFVEINPNLNNFYVAINNGVYGGASLGDTNTATPGTQATAVGSILDGNDYISALKITHTDDYGQTVDNENFSLNSAYKFVRPYTPAAPTVFMPTVGTVRVVINPHASETDGLEYAIYESTQNKYVQNDGSLGDTPVWQTRGTGIGQWGQYSGVTGGITVNGLVNDSYTYIFQIKSRNSSDLSHAVSSESVLSTGASSANQSPELAIDTVAQTTDGTKFVPINYTGSDLESETINLTAYQYSLDGVNWFTMTEKSGVGSNGVSDLIFNYGGSPYLFAWDLSTDLLNTEDSTVYVRLRANDGTSDGNLISSEGFIVDTKNPIISNVNTTQISGTNNIFVSYDLADMSVSSVEIDISEDGGATWTVADTSVSGDIGGSISAGNGKNIIWNAGNDFSGQEQSDMRVRVRALDAFGNQGGYTESTNFALDTKAPTISNVSATQTVSANTVTIQYDLNDANAANVEIDISDDGGATWNVTDTSVSGNVGTGQTTGTNKTITWQAGTDFPNQDQLDMRVRVRAIDVFNNTSSNIESSNFSLDTLGPSFSNLSVAQVLNSENVNVNYNLSDNSAVTIEIDISEDSGATWSVNDNSVSGNIGAGVTQGTGKVITWNAGADFTNQEQNDLRVRIRGFDIYGNSSGDLESADFLLDTWAPRVNVSSDLINQAQAGDTILRVGGSFTEANPLNNIFYVAINGAAYTAGQAGDTNTATPSDLNVNVGATLDGNDYVLKVKIVHQDQYSHTQDNENLSPQTVYKYVKPYTPQAPSVTNPQNTSVDLTINAHAAETSGLEYAVYESSQDLYVQADGSLDTTAVWQTIPTWGTINVTGLNSPVANYSFQVKSRNTSDTSHAASSESNLSTPGKINNTAPSLTISSVSQVNGGVNYVLISYTGTDAQNDTNNLSVYEYSRDGVTWSAMTEKLGVGSDGTSGLIFGSAGTSYDFAWDSGADLLGVEDSTVYVRLQSSDTLASSNLLSSSAFAVDNLGPSVSNIITSQNVGSNIFEIQYDLSDNSGSGLFVEAEISNDGGASWTVATSSFSGAIASAQTAGSGKIINWDAGLDYPNQNDTDMRIRIRARDTYGNQGAFLASNDFVLDTQSPLISNIFALQDLGSGVVTINYELSDISAAGNTVEIEISDDSGSTWLVASSSVSGDIASGITTGDKTVYWNSRNDWPGNDQNNLRVRLRARDYFGNQGSYSESADFSVDNLAPLINNLSAVQEAGSDMVKIIYDLSDTNASNTVLMDISSDGGVNWDTPDFSASGEIGANLSVGVDKEIFWDAGIDFANQEQTDLRVRLRAADKYENQSAYLESADFALDTRAPLNLTNIVKYAQTENTVTLNWSSGVGDANFSRYEIWHGSSSSDVDNRSGTAQVWNTGDDASLSNINTIATVITDLSFSDNYFVKIWALDAYGNEATLSILNLYEVPIPAEEEVVVSGSAFVASRQSIMRNPVLALPASPSSQNYITISGLAEPRASLELYDENILVAKLKSAADNNGLFAEEFNLSEGRHLLKIKAIDTASGQSAFSNEVELIIDNGAPFAPVVLNYTKGQTISDDFVQLLGQSEADSQIEIILDKEFVFGVKSDNFGNWSFVLPNQFALGVGEHEFALSAFDLAGNKSAESLLRLNKITQPISIIPVSNIAIPSQVAPFEAPGLEQPLPSELEISELTRAVELPGIRVPTISQVAGDVRGQNFEFTGTALPNKDIVVYIHSSEALLYRTRTDEQGIWKINHSQELNTLASGEHTIFAVTVDTAAGVKSRPSIVNKFEIKRNLWVALYNYLNLQTTIFALVIIVMTMVWLNQEKNKQYKKI